MAAAARYVLGRVSEPRLLESVTQNGAWLGSRLREVGLASGRARGLRGVGYIWGMDVVEPAMSIVRRGWDAGLMLLTAGEHTLRILPPLIMTRAQLERGLGVLEAIL